MSNDPRSVVQGNLRTLERLEDFVPGFKGYKEKELRRQSDRLLREMLMRQFQEQKNRIGEAESALMAAGKIEGLARLETVNLKLQLLIDHLRTGATGYAGLFDAVKIREPELDRVYQFDMALGEGVGRIRGIIDQISTMTQQGQDPGPVVNGLVTAAEELNQTWNHRVAAMQGLAS